VVHAKASALQANYIGPSLRSGWLDWSCGCEKQAFRAAAPKGAADSGVL